MAATPRIEAPLRALFVGLEEHLVQAILDALVGAGFRPEAERATSCSQLRRLLRTGPWDFAFAAARARRCDAKRALNTLNGAAQGIPLVVVGSLADTDEAIAAMRLGARDFVRSDSIAWVVPIVERELHTAQLLASRDREHADRDTEVLELTERLRQRQTLHLVGAAVGGIAHDFNNLLFVVMSYARAALEDLNPPAELREDLTEIIKASESAAELSRQLLGFVRPKPREQTTCDANLVISGMERIFRRIIGERIELVLSLSPHLPLVRTSPGHLEQILMNLVVNARDAMPDGGRLRVATARAEAPRDTQPGSGSEPGVILMISDSGIGMDESTRARIFEPFFTTKTEGKGTGLGLPTVLDIVRQNEGTLQLMSEQGHGTTFEICLPAGARRKPRKMRASASHTRGRTHGAGERVLLVEDDVRVQRCLERVLLRHGYSVSASSSAEEALRFVKTGRPSLDLLICDVVLPGASGPALVEHLSRLKKAPPTLFITGHSDGLVARNGLDHSSSHLLRKPVGREDLLREVREIIDGTGSDNGSEIDGGEP